MTVFLANAPVSFGVFGLAPPDFVPPDAESLVRALSEIGYRGIDLGPVGYLGRGADLRRRLQSHSVGLAGGWVDLPFFDADAYRQSLPQLDAALDVFDEAAPSPAGLPGPKPTLAVTARPIREAFPAGGAAHPEIGLDAGGWRTFARTLADAAGRCTDRGYTPTFHPHVATDVESPAEISRLLECADIDITLDTGHLIVGGGDPVEACAQWGSRINHLHLKDARTSVIAGQVAAGGDVRSIWAAGVFCPIGSGELDLPGVLNALGALGYQGWAVVEQDVIPGPDHDLEAMLADQRHNFTALTVMGVGAR